MFLNPLMIAGLGGAVVPLVLHLLAKARYRSLDWGAMIFLQGADARQHQSTRLKQWLLLLIRMAIVALLAMALARPVVKANWAGLAEKGRVTAVIVLDGSMSMSREEMGHSRFDKARDLVLQILGSLQRGDRAALILAGQSSADRSSEPTSDLQSLVTRVTALKPGRGMADLAAAMQAALEVLEKSEPMNRRMYVITDWQAVSWRNADPVFRSTWRNRLSEPNHIPATVICPVGGKAVENVVVENVQLLSPPAICGQTSELEVTLRNYGSAPCMQLPLTATVYSKELFNTTVNLPGDAKTTVKIPIQFNDPGTRIVTVAVKTTGQVSDDALECAVEVSNPLRVLLVSGDERVEAFRSKSAYLRVALSPYASVGKKLIDLAKVTVQPIEKWNTNELDKYQVVILANVETLSPPQVREVEQFVFSGGGLLVAPGKLSQAQAYTSALYRDGAGVLPAALQPAVDAPGATLLGIDLASPVFAFLRRQPRPLPSAVIDRYFPAIPNAGSRVLASFSTGQPYCITGQFGRGRVALMTASLDVDWSNLPLTNFFLPFVQSSVRYLAGGKMPARNLEIGEPVEMSVDQIEPRSASIVLPSGLMETPEVTRVEARTDLRYTNTQESGRYQLLYRSNARPCSEYFVVNPPRQESNLAPLSDEQVKALQEDLHCLWIDPTKTPVTLAVADERSSRELWAALLGAVFGLTILELGLARRWSQEAA